MRLALIVLAWLVFLSNMAIGILNFLRVWVKRVRMKMACPLLVFCAPTEIAATTSPMASTASPAVIIR